MKTVDHLSYTAFASLTLSEQEQLTKMCNDLYQADDCTPLQEIAARAYLLGRMGEEVDKKQIMTLCPKCRHTVVGFVLYCPRCGYEPSLTLPT